MVVFIIKIFIKIYVIDFISFIAKPQNDELIIMSEKINSSPQEFALFD